MYRNCQVCGNPIFSANDYGTEPDGRFNLDFCSNCYRSGHFYTRDPIGDADGPMPYAPLVAGHTGIGIYNGGNNVFNQGGSHV